MSKSINTGGVIRCLAATVLVGAAVGVWAYRKALLMGAAAFLDVTGCPRPADYAFVLAGDPEVRPFAAAELYNQGVVKGILIDKVKPSPAVRAGLVRPHHELLREILRRNGVPDSAIKLLPGEVTSTLDEARVLAQFLSQHPDASVIVVTTCFHTRRTRLLFSATLGPLAERVQYFGAPNAKFAVDDWWLTREGFLTYLTEYLKLGVYELRYALGRL